MSDFEPLTTVLESWFGSPLCELPDVQRQRAERDLFPLRWDELTADQRRSAVRQWDYQHDPATQEDRQFWWDLYQRRRARKEQISE